MRVVSGEALDDALCICSSSIESGFRMAMFVARSPFSIFDQCLSFFSICAKFSAFSLVRRSLGVSSFVFLSSFLLVRRR